MNESSFVNCLCLVLEICLQSCCEFLVIWPPITQKLCLQMLLLHQMVLVLICCHENTAPSPGVSLICENKQVVKLLCDMKVAAAGANPFCISLQNHLLIGGEVALGSLSGLLQRTCPLAQNTVDVYFLSGHLFDLIIAMAPIGPAAFKQLLPCPSSSSVDTVPLGFFPLDCFREGPFKVLEAVSAVFKQVSFYSQHLYPNLPKHNWSVWDFS